MSISSRVDKEIVILSFNGLTYNNEEHTPDTISNMDEPPRTLQWTTSHVYEYTIFWFSICEVKEHAKVIYSDRSQKNNCLRVGK